MEDNPYQAPAFTEPSTLSSSSVSEQEIRAFVVENASYYLGKWSEALDGRGRARGFNWAACLLSTLWLPYRKMYRITLFLFGILATETVLVQAALAAGVPNRWALATLESTIELVIAIICGAYGNGWYLEHARREIGRIRALGLEDDAYYWALTCRGGTNTLGSLGLSFLFALAAALLRVAVGSQFSNG